MCVASETPQALIHSYAILESWLAMAQETDKTIWTTGDEAFAPLPQRIAKKISVEEIAEAFQLVAEDIAQIGKLTTEENSLFKGFLKTLKTHLEPLKKPIGVSIKIIPIDLGIVKEAYIQSTGKLQLTFVDGRIDLVDLSASKNRDLMLAVIDDVMPKLEALIREIEEANYRRTHHIEEPRIEMPAPKPTPVPVMPEPMPVPAIAIEPPLSIPEESAAVEPEPIPTSEPALEPMTVLLTERNNKIEAITSETLLYLDMLGGEVFEQEPVSKYFDDWMVNLRQTILSFESNQAIGADEGFNTQYNKIFGQIQTELDNRIAMEGDMAVSYRTLIENRYLLNKIDEEQKAQTKEFVEKGASNIETLMRNMANLEKELSEAQAVKVSYLHPMQMMAKDQKVHDLILKLNLVKKQLAMAVGTSSTEGGKSGDLDAQFEVQAKMLEGKRKIAMEMLNKNVDDLANEIAKLKMTKTSNPIKRVSIQQTIFELEQKMVEAKKSVTLAEQNSSTELQKLKEEFEKKKQAALGKVQTLEKDIAKKAVDNSAGVRKQAAEALVEAVKALSAKKLALPVAPVKPEGAQS
ncbi:MAG TPA: hypothetical protein VLH35_05520 [Candidatus Acidoferrales bacterium]|nr:hypothetical protein [Candidatus Acidoferrales bacterium]